MLNIISRFQQAEAPLDRIREGHGLVHLRVSVLEVRLEAHRTDKLLQANGAHIHKGMLPDMSLECLELGRTVITQLAAKGPLAAVYHQMTIAVQFVLKFSVTYLTVI